ncbi:MAG TPA: prenyltransferase, partial [Candidatus Elarobacter sp.]|nr:prenyltransferase [Candidatus Elarobacter sp.]
MEASVPELRLPPLRAFLRLSRPLFLYGGFAGVALGAAVARRSGHPLDAWTYAWVQLLVSSFHLMVHYANDYFDRESDATAVPTRWSGGSRVLVDGHLHPRVALYASLACAAIGFAACVRFVVAGNPLVAAIGVGIFVFAWAYSAPPARFAARGLGELDTALVVAVLFPFAAYAAFTRTLDGSALTTIIPPAFAMIAMMLGVELPDADCDEEAGKRNLVVRWGCAQAWRLITVAAALSAVFAVVLAVRIGAGLATVGLVPAVIAAARLVRLTTGDPRPGSIA